MSGVQIQGGTGDGFSAKVDSNHRLHTYSVTISEEHNANFNGDAYNINTGIITLTNATETPVLYVKNNEDEDLHIKSVVLWSGATTGGTTTEDITWTVVRNPTSGTIVSGATAVDIEQNRNFASNNLVLLDSYKGATGSTMTDGDDYAIINTTNQQRSAIPLDTILPEGTSIGVKVAPQSSNTSMTVYVALICHFEG